MSHLQLTPFKTGEAYDQRRGANRVLNQTAVVQSGCHLAPIRRNQGEMTMDIKKMAELVRAKMQEVEEAGIFDELAQAAEVKGQLERKHLVDMNSHSIPHRRS